MNRPFHEPRCERDGPRSLSLSPTEGERVPKAGEGLVHGPDARQRTVAAINAPETLLAFPQLAGTKRVAQRITPQSAMENLRIIEQLQRWLHTNVQEALALEVGLLKLQL